MRTAAGVGWVELPDGELLRAAAASFDVIVTVDRALAHAGPVPGRLAVLLLVSVSNRVADLEPLVPVLRVALARPTRGAVTVVRR